MDGKVFLKETKTKLRKVLEDAIKLGVFGELVDGPIIGGMINIVDHYGDKAIPDEYDPVINRVVTNILDKNYDAAKTELATLANQKIDIPLIDEATEEMVFQTGFNFLVSLLSNYVKKKMEKKD